MRDLLPLVAFTFVAGITPGPNNTLLMLSGAHWGFRATLPLLLGIITGFPLMFLAVGLGLGKAFEAWPMLHAILKIVSVTYLLVLAWKLLRAGAPDAKDGPKGRPIRYPTALALQWINPKAWLMAVTALSLYVPAGAPPLPSVLKIVAVFFLLAIPCSLVWLLGGTAVTRFLTNPRRVAVFNAAMAILLVLSLVPILF